MVAIVVVVSNSVWMHVCTLNIAFRGTIDAKVEKPQYLISWQMHVRTNVSWFQTSIM